MCFRRSNARAAQPLLTSDKYGNQYSHMQLKSWVAEEMNAIFKYKHQAIASDDSFIPKTYTAKVMAFLNEARTTMVDVQAMVSSVYDLTEVLKRQVGDRQVNLEKQKRHTQNAQTKQYSSEHITKTLGIEIDENEGLEGAILYKWGQVQSMFAFDNRTIEQLPRRK